MNIPEFGMVVGCLFRVAPADDDPVLRLHQEQQSPAWIGGHGTEPQEQNTQQSPCRGFNLTPHPLQS
jgi:hypothetical protein